MSWTSLIDKELFELTISVLLLAAAVMIFLVFTWWSRRRLSQGELASLRGQQNYLEQRLKFAEQAIEEGAADQKVHHEEDVMELLGSLREVAVAIRERKNTQGG